MNKIKSLASLKKKEPEYIALATLPEAISMTDYAIQKAYKINELVKKIHKGSYEWYGFLIANMDNPELVIDIGIGKNDENQHAYTKITEGEIEKFREDLPLDKVINGWIHSHADLNYRQFSGTDDGNHITVLNYVTSLLKKPIAKKEIDIENLELLVEGHYTKEDLMAGTMSIITDVPIARARIMETIEGGFSYAVVIGDEGWHEQSIYYKKKNIISGYEKLTYLEKAHINPIKTGKILTAEDIKTLEEEVKEKIKPPYTNWWRGAGKLIGNIWYPDRSYAQYNTGYSYNKGTDLRYRTQNTGQSRPKPPAYVPNTYTKQKKTQEQEEKNPSVQYKATKTTYTPAQANVKDKTGESK